MPENKAAALKHTNASFKAHRCRENVKRFNAFYFVKFDCARTHCDGLSAMSPLIFFCSLFVSVCVPEQGSGAAAEK